MAVPRRTDASAGAEAPWSVSRLAEQIDVSLRRGIAGTLRVVGEISGFRDRTHWYFDLKDQDAVVNCVMFASAARRINQPPRDGELVVVKGRVEYYAKGGKVSFILESLERAGEGPRDRAFRELCAKLKADGAFDPDRKKPLPRFPRRIAVITSRSAAALQDVINTRDRRCPAVGLACIDVPVQGDNAAPLIAHAIRAVSIHGAKLGFDAILLTRGGGSKEDLWCFNDPQVAEAILSCRLPLVAAIGHEIDTTIAELVADERCATPTQAAMRLIPDRRELERQLDSTTRRLGAALSRGALSADRNCQIAEHRLAGGMTTRCREAHRRLASVELNLEQVKPQSVHARMIARLDDVSRRLTLAIEQGLDIDLASLQSRLADAAAAGAREQASRLSALDRHLNAVGPQKVLERGFSMTARKDGRLLRSIQEVKPGESLRTRLADGTFDSTVGGSPGLASGPRRTKPAQPGLFPPDGA
ncbi:MAG: exodeoxyribonuclease VII large subunit [Planctomycetes bacterium]|nr:exodeoxyribonuclease VII large subunit [Planctomycetota bacterium]